MRSEAEVETEHCVRGQGEDNTDASLESELEPNSRTWANVGRSDVIRVITALLCSSAPVLRSCLSVGAGVGVDPESEDDPGQGQPLGG